MSGIKISLREPLVHFLLIGAGIFLLYYVTNGPADIQPNRIVVTADQVAQMESRFSRTWMRPPTQEEMAGLIENHVRDEVYYREAVTMGLDRNDPSIRKRMRLKLEFLLEDLSAVEALGDEALNRYLEAHPEDFRVEARISFQQVYLDPVQRKDMDAEAESMLARLHRGTDPETVGDATLVEFEHRRAPRSDVARWFGEPFAEQVFSLAPGVWSGPHFSGLGGHLVKVTERVESRMPALDEVRDRVERELIARRRQEMKDMAYRRLRDNYEVVIQPPPSETANPGEAVAAAIPGGAGK